MGGVEFRLLGAVGAWCDGMAVDLGHGRRRCVLAALLVDANQVVSAEQLMERAWGESAPRQGKDTLYAYVSRLRNVFRGMAGVAITRNSGGYVLTVDQEAVDLHRFHRLLAQARAATDAAAKLALLDQALALWQGEVFAELDTPWLDNVRQGLAKERSAAELDRIDLLLGLGRHAELVTELAAAVRRHPLDERLAGQFMLALYRSGRQAEALDAYQRLRDRLSDELGVDPWPDLQRLRTSILRQDPGLAPPAVRAETRPTPAQLPVPVPHFTGRHAELRELDAVLGRAAPVVISAVTGTGGVGKTALAAQWAHQHSDDFPDGHLYVNLRGYDVAEPMTASAALEGFLRALGFEPTAIPSTVDERSALYRSALAGRRMLVLLDNARSADQVRPLLPGRHGCVVLVTSRDDLAGLVARDGAHRLTVQRLTEPEAVELLRQVLGADRVSAEPGAAADLARRCALLPLALRVAAERAARRRETSLADLVAELEDLDALDVPDDPTSAVRVVFSWSYLALPKPAARLFRLLGLHAGQDFSAAAAASLAGVELAPARRLLDVLRSAHLVEQTAPDRFQLHDLLRLYARQLAERSDDEHVRAQALRRLSTWYLHATYCAVDQVNPAMLHLPRPEFVAVELGDGMAWLEAERRNLVAVIRQAGGPVAWRLADALRGFFWLRKYHDDWQEALAEGLRAARFDGGLRALAAMHHGMATAQLSLSHYTPAIEHFEQARRFSERAGWHEAQAAALGNLGVILRHQGKLREAAVHHTRALAVVRSIGAPVREAEVLGNLGNVYLELGRLRLAELHCTEAMEIHRRHASRVGEAIDLGLLGQICCELGEFERASAYLARALEIHRDTAAREMEGDVHARLASVACAEGAFDRAEAHARQALQLARETESRGTELDAHNALGVVDRRWGRFDQAVERHRRALDIAREDGYRRGEVESLIELSTALAALGQDAADPAERAAGLARDAGYRVLHGRALTALAAARFAHGAVDAAVACCEEALGVHLDTGHRPGHADALSLLARLTN